MNSQIEGGTLPANFMMDVDDQHAHNNIIHILWYRIKSGFLNLKGVLYIVQETF